MDTVTAAAEPHHGEGARALIDRLVDQLREHGRPPSPLWVEALSAVPRDRFVPQVAWAAPDQPGRGGYRIDAAADPTGWWQTVYSDASLIIQADDGAGDPTAGQGVPSSSVSAPGVVFAFLDLLDVRPGDRVLDVGTGSGWTAALLSWRAGDGNVTSIEIDPRVAGQAAANLANADRGAASDAPTTSASA